MPNNNWDQYVQKPAGGSQWDQYSQSAPPAPTSGPIGEKVPEPQSLRQGGSAPDQAAYTAVEGAKGIGQGLIKTAQNIHNSNMALAPSNSPLRSSAPFPGVDTTAHTPDEQAGQFVEGLGEMAAPIGEGKSAIEGVKNLLPSAERAGGALNSLSAKLRGVPVSLANTTPALERAAQITDAGGGNMGAAGKLMYRSHGMVSMDFPEGRDFYSNISRQSATDKMGQSPMLQRQIGKVANAFHGDLASTADKALPATEIGYRGQAMNGGKLDYENAMDEYKHAKQLQGAGKFLVNKAAPAGLVAGAGKLAYDKIRGH